MESDTEEDDLESGFEEMKSEEEEETLDPHSSKFRATGQLLLHYEEEPSFEGYLMFKSSKRQVRQLLCIYLVFVSVLSFVCFVLFFLQGCFQGIGGEKVRFFALLKTAAFIV